MSESAKAAVDIQAKFELYFVTLVFTLLGLAIQTSKPAVNTYLAFGELLSWILLLSAGLIGMYRIVRIPMILNVFAEINRTENLLQELQKHSHTNSAQHIQTDVGIVPISDVISNRELEVNALEKQKKSINNALIKLFEIQWYLFIFSLIFLILSRGNEQFYLLWNAMRSFLPSFSCS